MGDTTQLLTRIQELEIENNRLRSQLDRQTSGTPKKNSAFRERYAEYVLDTLPDMLTVWSNKGVIEGLISSEKTNHVGIPSSQFIGMNISELLPSEAYEDVRENLNRVLATNKGATGRHDLFIDNELRHFENRIWPLNETSVFCMCCDVTDSVHTEHAMDEANKRMKLIEKVASLGYWFYYEDKNEFYVPDILSVLLDWNQGEDNVNADYYFEHYVHPEDRQKARQQLLHADPARSDEDYVEFRILVNGKTKYLRHRVFCESIRNGKQVIEGYVQDVTSIVERFHEQETLKYAVNNAREAIFSCTIDGSMCFANQAFLDYHQIKNGDLANYKFYDLPGWDSSLHKFKNLIGLLTGRKGTLRKACHLHFNTEERERVMDTMIYLLDDDVTGKQVVWFFCRDVTERIKQEKELGKLNRLLQAILENIPVYLFVKDPNNEFRYLYWNKSFVQHSGIPASRVIGKTDYEIFPRRQDAEQFLNNDHVLLEKGRLGPFEEQYSDVSGNLHTISTIRMLIPVRDQKVPLVMGISWDVTDQKVIEKELIAAKLKAEQSDQLKTAFLANMSHEIRTPLNAIVGFAKILPEITDEVERVSITNIIDQNSDQLLMLINDILDLAKIEAGSIEFVYAPADLTELCQNIYYTLFEKTSPGVELIFEGAFDHLSIICDQGRLSQVVVNLITNAIKFTKQGTIRYGYVVKDRCIEFYVSDTGIGIPSDKIESIFNRFTKLNTFISGTGLGLAICKMIVEKQKGKIWVESNDGVGSVFKCSFPYQKS